MSIPEVELQNASLQAAGRSGSNPWQLFLYFIFPIPLVFLVLISLPFPARYRAKIRVGILAALNKISFLRFDYGGASISLIAIIILFAGLGLIFSANDSLNARASENQALFFAEKKELRCKRWRAERNFWLSVLGCVLWLVLLRIQTLLMDVGPLEERLKGVEEERDSLKKEKKEKEGVLERLRAAVEEGGREGKEREGMILALKEKVGELDTLKKKVAKLEIENESLKRGEKKTS